MGFCEGRATAVRGLRGAMGLKKEFLEDPPRHLLHKGPLGHHPFIRNALGAGGSPNVLSAFPPYTLGLGLSYLQIFVCLVAAILSV